MSLLFIHLKFDFFSDHTATKLILLPAAKISRQVVFSWKALNRGNTKETRTYSKFQIFHWKTKGHNSSNFFRLMLPNVVVTVFFTKKFIIKRDADKFLFWMIFIGWFQVFLWFKSCLALFLLMSHFFLLIIKESTTNC